MGSGELVDPAVHKFLQWLSATWLLVVGSAWEQMVCWIQCSKMHFTRVGIISEPCMIAVIQPVLGPAFSVTASLAEVLRRSVLLSYGCINTCVLIGSKIFTPCRRLGYAVTAA